MLFTYLLIISISTLTLLPLVFDPSVVVVSVCGIKAIEILSSFTFTTVRLMPSIATDPLDTNEHEYYLSSILIHIYVPV